MRTREQWLKDWDEKIAALLEDHKRLHPEMARDMQRFLEDIETRLEAMGMPIPKRSHLFAPERLFPKPN